MPSKIETVWMTETENGIVVKINKKTIPDRDNKVTFSVNLGRKNGDRTMPLFLKRGEDAHTLVSGLEDAVVKALEEGDSRFKKALAQRPRKEVKRPLTSYKPRKEAYGKIGTHGRQKDPIPREEKE